MKKFLKNLLVYVFILFIIVFFVSMATGIIGLIFGCEPLIVTSFLLAICSFCLTASLVSLAGDPCEK